LCYLLFSSVFILRCLSSSSLLYSSPAPAHLPSFPTRRSSDLRRARGAGARRSSARHARRQRRVGDRPRVVARHGAARGARYGGVDRKSTRLNSSHQIISYAVFCLKKKKKNTEQDGK